MKTITKIKESSKAVAGTALLVGATLAGGAAFATAQDSGSSGDLGDYPSPFIDDDGNIASTIVMGEDAKATDVVAATEIAGQLGNDAFSEETASVDVSGSFGWSADGGVTLDTRNDDLYFGQAIDEVRQTLTEDQLDVLQTQEVLSGDAEQEVEQYLYLGNQEVNYGNPGDTSNEEDPFMYVRNPSSVTVAEDGADADDDNGRLYKLQANFEDGVEFLDDANDDNDNRNEDVYGEEIAMFGMDFTVAESSFQDGNENQLVLYGSQEEVDVASGESTTVTINGEEHTIEVVGVTGTNTAAVRIDGSLEQYSQNDEETVSGEELRVDNIIQTNADNSQGVVQFAIGSQQVTLESGEPIMEGSDDEEIDGTMVQLSGENVNDGGNDVTGGTTHTLSSVEVAVGADDSDNNYVEAGETFEDPVFNDVEFHFGGLNPDVQSEDSSASEVEFGTDGDDTATVSFSDGDNSVTTGFMYDGDLTSDNNGENLAVDENEPIQVVEGEAVQEDEYFVSDAGDFSHMWQVTSIDADQETGNDGFSSDDEATIELEDAVTGASVEVDLDPSDEGTIGNAPEGNNNDIYIGEEVIDGQTYHFWTDAADGSVEEVYVTWDSGSDYDDNGDRTSVFTAVDAEGETAVAFTEEQTDVTTGLTGGDSVTYELPSTESTDRQTVTLNVQDSGDTNDFDVVVDGTTELDDVSGGNFDYTVGNTQYVFTVTEDGAGNTAADDVSVDIALASDQTGAEDDDNAKVGGPAALVLQPEDDNDNELGYIVEPGNDDGSDEEVTIGEGQANIFYTGAGGWSPSTLESDDDIQVQYNTYGTYAERDTDEQGSFTLHLPDGQSTAGAAVTGAEGSLEASAGSSGSVDTMTPTGFPAQSVALDSDDFVPEARTSSNLILVGGPAANSLVEELANNNKTWSTSDYTEGEGLLQLVPEAFNEDHDALVVAGYTGEDTRQAGEFLSNYEQNSEALAGQTQVSISTAEGSVVQ